MKLKKLSGELDSTPTVAPAKFEPAVVNLSNTTFSSSELQLLEPGKKSLPPVDQKSKLKTVIVSDLANGIRGDLRLNTDRVRNLINDMTSQLHAPLTPELSTYFGLKRRLNQSSKGGQGRNPSHYGTHSI